jgi:hypothetical protein
MNDMRDRIESAQEQADDAFQRFSDGSVGSAGPGRPDDLQ